LISIQTKLSTNVRQRCYKHLAWQRERIKNNDEFSNLDEKILQTNLISYAQEYISIMSKKILSTKTNFLQAKDPIRMVSVKFLEPESDIEQVLEFLPGLSVSIPCLMNAKNLDRQQNLNIKVCPSKFQFPNSIFLSFRSLISMDNIVYYQSMMIIFEH
jgi:hypothetical protein